jgi:hypothetical protein
VGLVGRSRLALLGAWPRGRKRLRTPHRRDLWRVPDSTAGSCTRHAGSRRGTRVCPKPHQIRSVRQERAPFGWLRPAIKNVRCIVRSRGDRPRCSSSACILRSSQRPRRPRLILPCAAARYAPGKARRSPSAAARGLLQRPAQWNLVHAVGSSGDRRHRRSRSARSPGSPDRRGGEDKTGPGSGIEWSAHGSPEPDGLRRGRAGGPRR